MWAPLFLVIVLVLIGYGIGYPHGRADERKFSRFTPVDKIEPREGYHPPLVDPRWEVERPQQNSGPKPVRAPSDFIQGITKGGDVYRYYDLEEL